MKKYKEFFFYIYFYHDFEYAYAFTHLYRSNFSKYHSIFNEFYTVRLAETTFYQGNIFFFKDNQTI